MTMMRQVISNFLISLNMVWNALAWSKSESNSNPDTSCSSFKMGCRRVCFVVFGVGQECRVDAERRLSSLIRNLLDGDGMSPP